MKNSFLMICLCFISIASGFAQTLTRAQTLRNRYLIGPDSSAVNADDANRIWIMAHRGAWNEANPESSLGAFQRAVDLKFEIIELDVLLSSRYNIVNGKQVSNRMGTNRGEICFTHDPQPDRAFTKDGIPNENDVIGLYTYAGTHIYTYPPGYYYTELNTQKTAMRIDQIVPTSSTGTNSIDGSGGEHPILQKLDGTASSYKMLHFPSNATTATNTDFASFSNIVKDKILLNIDKLKDTADFRAVYDLFNANGLLAQTIFKGKGIRSFADIQNKFGTSRNISQVMFTPIFTQWDFCTEVNGQPVSVEGMTNDKKLVEAKEVIDNLLAKSQQGKFVFPGVEVVYETDDVNNDWLAGLAKYVKSKKKRVIQFSTIMESKSGGWNGGGHKWSDLVNRQVNYWSWLFNNPTIKTNKILPSVFVGDKSLELRSYLNALGYNQKPIN